MNTEFKSCECRCDCHDYGLNGSENHDVQCCDGFCNICKLYIIGIDNHINEH